MAVQQILCVSQVVKNLSTIADWYVANLQATSQSEDGFSGRWLEQLFSLPTGSLLQRRRLQIGEESVQIWHWQRAEDELSRLEHALFGTQGTDLWFQHLCVVSNSLASVYSEHSPLSAYPISSSPQVLPEWNKSAAGIQAVKFFDPSGYPLELLQFPPDKGDARWHRPDPPSPILGIDHTAISIRDTDSSLRFYCDLLGFHLQGSNDNSGSEQDHMDGLVDTKVHISSLRPAQAGMGVEFLNYQVPKTGRTRLHPSPIDEIERTTCCLVSGIDALHGAMMSSPWLSHCGPLVEIPGDFLGPSRAFVCRDPDGHALLLTSD